jgi:hypothetical protein
VSQEAEAAEKAHAPIPGLPPGYILDESDPDVFVLRRPDGSFLAAFSALGATEESIRQVAVEDL